MEKLEGFIALHLEAIESGTNLLAMEIWRQTWDQKKSSIKSSIENIQYTYHILLDWGRKEDQREKRTLFNIYIYEVFLCVCGIITFWNMFVVCMFSVGSLYPVIPIKGNSGGASSVGLPISIPKIMIWPHSFLICHYRRVFSILSSSVQDIYIRMYVYTRTHTIYCQMLWKVGTLAILLQHCFSPKVSKLKWMIGGMNKQGFFTCKLKEKKVRLRQFPIRNLGGLDIRQSSVVWNLVKWNSHWHFNLDLNLPLFPLAEV